MPNPESIKGMKRAIYYASKGVRAAYLGYDGAHRDNVYDLIQMIDNLYYALEKEEAAKHDR